jgi:UDP-glucose 4-epimerase
MKIWITGVGGFLGSHLAEALLKDGHSIGGNDNLICGSRQNVPDNVEFVYTDCCDQKLMRYFLEKFKPEVIVHCAATAHEGLSSFSPSFITRNIYEASVATFSAAIASGVKRIVYMSSMSRYGDQEPPFVEEMKPKPVDPYGVAKVAAEQTLKILCETHGVNYAIAVPHNIIGIRQRSCDPYRNVASIMINRCKQGKPPIVYGDGEQTRCFSPVKDCIPSLLKMINGEADGHVVNIGPDKGEITIRELAETVCLYTGCLDAPVHMDGRPNEVRDAYCSSHKVRTLLDYKPQQTIHECLKEMVDAIEPSPFIYDFPIEIQTERTPKTWTEKLM